MNTLKQCPFKVGDTIVYQPSDKGRGEIIMTDLASLKPGNKYKIAKIEEDNFIVPEGFENAVPCSLYWTEFSKQSDLRPQAHRLSL